MFIRHNISRTSSDAKVTWQNCGLKHWISGFLTQFWITLFSRIYPFIRLEVDPTFPVLVAGISLKSHPWTQDVSVMWQSCHSAIWNMKHKMRRNNLWKMDSKHVSSKTIAMRPARIKSISQVNDFCRNVHAMWHWIKLPCKHQNISADIL